MGGDIYLFNTRSFENVTCIHAGISTSEKLPGQTKKIKIKAIFTIQPRKN